MAGDDAVQEGAVERCEAVGTRRYKPRRLGYFLARELRSGDECRAPAVARGQVQNGGAKGVGGRASGLALVVRVEVELVAGAVRAGVCPEFDKLGSRADRWAAHLAVREDGGKEVGPHAVARGGPIGVQHVRELRHVREVRGSGAPVVSSETVAVAVAREVVAGTGAADEVRDEEGKERGWESCVDGAAETTVQGTGARGEGGVAVGQDR